MIMPCPCRVDCPGIADSPIANLTSEPPDRLINIGYSWGWDLNYPLLGWNFGDPINNPSFCESTVSQEEADLCAARDQVGCLTGICGPGSSGPAIPWRMQNGSTVQTFLNAAAFCTVLCADGLPFTYTVRAGLFRSFNQQQADEIAISYACKLANINSVCFGSITGACLNQNYLSVISVTGGFAPYTITRIGGVLPPGVGFVQDTPTTAFLSGIPTATGAFTFTLLARDTKGNFMQKDFTCYVLDVSNKATIPLPSVGTFYNFQLAGVGGVAPYTFSNAVGLPGGLVLQVDGFIVGNPIAPIGTGFTCTMADSAGHSCIFALSYTTCSFGAITWNNPPNSFTTPSAPNAFTFAITYPTPHSVRLVGTATMVAVDFALTYTNSNSNSFINLPAGPDRQCTLTITVRNSTGQNVYQVEVADTTFTTFYVFSGIVNNPPVGTTVVNFTIPAGVTQIAVGFSYQAGNPAPPTNGALDIQFDFGT